MNVALLVIDMQKAFIDEKKTTENYEIAMWVINHTANLLRSLDKPVVLIKDIEEGDGPDFDFVDELEIHQKDFMITKTFNNSFWNTELEQKLKERNIDTVILCGNALEHCVTATYFGAKERGFKTMLLQQGIFAQFDENLNHLYHLRPLISYSALKGLLK